MCTSTSTTVGAATCSLSRHEEALTKSETESAAALAHRFAFTVERVAILVLGVKESYGIARMRCPAGRGPLDPGLIARIDTAVGQKLTLQDGGIREVSGLDSQASTFLREWSKIALPDDTPIAITL